MDLNYLTNLFATTYNPDPNVRKAAELEIRKIGNEEGLITALLQLITSDSLDLATRQAALVWVKNRVKTGYPRSLDDPLAIKPSDRATLKSTLLPLISTSVLSSLVGQYSYMFKTVAANDFPHDWPSLTQEIQRLLNSNDIRDVHAGCIGALEAVRAFRYRQKSDHIGTLVNQLFPTLVMIASNMLQKAPDSSQEIPTMLHLILKTYNTSITISLSPHQQSSESFVPWGRVLFQVINLQLPKEVVPEDEEERERCEWWKAKKWAYRTLGRLFHRFGNPSQLPSTMKKTYIAFADNFVKNFAPEILSTYLQQVDLYVSGQSWISDKCQYHIFTFFTECVKPKSTWALLKPHFESLLEKFIFPQLIFNATKKDLWENDPIEYVRISVDEYENFATPVASATSFLFSLASNRAKSTFMPIMNFLSQVFQADLPPEQRFGRLNMLAALSPYIMRHPGITTMEDFIMQWVTPCLSDPEPYIRAIACEVIGTVTKSGLKWSTPENLDVNFRGVVSCLEDPNLPVRIQGILSLTEMIVVHNEVKTMVASSIEKVVHDLLKLCDETDLDILNHSMEVMVNTYQQELLPVATQLTQRLCESYMRLIAETAEVETAPLDTEDLDTLLDEKDDDKMYAAMGVCKTIWTIISAMDSSPDILAQIQTIVMPMILFTLEKRLLDLFDSIYDIVDTLTFKLRFIVPDMWKVFEYTFYAFKADAIDFIDEMLPTLDNLLSYGSEYVATRPDYINMFLEMYTIAMTDDHLGENDNTNACKLAECMLLNLRGNIDHTLPTIINISLQVLNKAITPALNLSNLNVLINAVLYNPQAALHLMENFKAGSTQVFFESWFKLVNKPADLPRVHDKKLTILALCALLEMVPSTVPESLKPAWPMIVGGILSVFQGYPQAVEWRQKLNDALTEIDEADEESEEDLLNLNGDDDDVWDEDSAYLEMLAREGDRLRANTEKLENGEDLDDDEDSVEDIEIMEELTYLSPLENVNPYPVFKRALTAFQMNDSNGYQAATTALDLEKQTLLMEVMKIADQPEVVPSQS